MARGILLGIHSLVACALFPFTGPLWPLFLYLHACVYLQSLMLTRPRMRPFAYRVLVTFPAAFFAGGDLARPSPGRSRAAFGSTPHGLWMPYVLAALGLVAVVRFPRGEEVDVSSSMATPTGCSADARGDAPRGAPAPLRADHRSAPRPVHVRRAPARRSASAPCERDPDLVLLTGDFLTMESQGDPERAGARRSRRCAALEGARVRVPRQPRSRGARARSRGALAHAACALLVDERRRGRDRRRAGCRSSASDFAVARPRRALAAAVRRAPAHRGRAAHRAAARSRRVPAPARRRGRSRALRAHPRRPARAGQPRAASRRSCAWSSRSPDHGLWARGPDRLYVHRGTGHYGFPLRLGVPAEESLLRVHA